MGRHCQVSLDSKRWARPNIKVAASISLDGLPYSSLGIYTVLEYFKICLPAVEADWFPE